MSLFDVGLDSNGATVVDFNRDGLPDLLVGNSFGSVAVLMKIRSAPKLPSRFARASSCSSNSAEFIFARTQSPHGAPAKRWIGIART